MANTLLLTGFTLADAASTANTTQFWEVCGNGQGHQSTEVGAQVLMRSSGTLSNMWIRITANTIAATPSVTVTSRVNTAAGNQSITPGSTATGAFTDSTHTDVLAAGAKIAMRSVPGAATNTFTMPITSFTFTSTFGTVTRLGSSLQLNINSVQAAQFTPIGGYMSSATAGFPAETTGAKCRQLKVGIFQNGCANIQTNTVTTNGSMKSRKNAGAGNISVTITASTAGFFEDTVHTDSVVSGDDYDLTYVSGTVGSNATLWINNEVDFSSIIGDCQLTNGESTVVTVLKNVTTNFVLGGDSAFTSTTELQTEALVGNAFTFSNMTILVTANTASATSTLTLRANAASPGSGPVVSITASTANRYSDTVHTYVAAATDLIDAQLFVGNAGTSLAFSNMSIWATLPVGIPAFQQFFTTKTNPSMTYLYQQNPGLTFAT